MQDRHTPANSNPSGNPRRSGSSQNVRRRKRPTNTQNVVRMLLGVLLYALLSGQQLPFTAYLSDIAMGVAGGGIAGAIVAGMRRR